MGVTMLKLQPRLSDLYDLISEVTSYPVAAERLVELAIRQNATPAVVGFYKSFPVDEVFESKEDLLARSEQITMLEQEHDQPFELMLASEED